MTAPPTLTPPPQALDAERSVLAAMLLGAETPALTPAAFYRDSHGKVYAAILALRERGVPADLVTLSEELRSRGDLDAVGGYPALSLLMEYASTTANTPHHARIVLDAHRRRLTRDAADRLSRAAVAGDVPVDDALGRFDGERERMPRGNGDQPTVTYLDMSAPAPPIEWIVPGWLARREIAVLASSAGSGKSTTVADLCIAVATGRPWCSTLQLAAGQTGPVLYFDEEQGAEEVSRLFQRLYGCQAHPNLHIASMQGIVLSSASGIERIEAQIKALRPVLVVLDTVAQVFAGVDLANLEEVSAAFRHLFRLRDTYGCTIMLLTHYRKAAKEENDLSALERVFGSIGFGGNPSTVWTANRQDGQALDIRQVKRRGARTQRIRVAYEENEIGEITLTAESVEQAEAEKDRAEVFVVNLLAGHPETRTGEITSAGVAAGFPKRTIERAMNQLVAVERITCIKRGVWRLSANSSANDFDNSSANAF
jgi:hypothetical protein